MSSPSISSHLRKLVIERAKQKCEYCLIHQDFSIYSHEIDHIIPLKHGGKNSLENLALSCLSCNRYKGTDFATIDPQTEKITRLFNPRRQAWLEHFQLNNAHIEGNTEVGKATVNLLRFNNPKRILERKVLIRQGFYP